MAQRAALDRDYPLPFHWSERSEWVAAPQQKRSQRSLASLLEAAANLFAREGFERATIAAIAREAGVSTTAIYRRFADKNAVFRAVVDIWSRSWTADSDRIWGEFDQSPHDAAFAIQFHIDLVFSAYRSDPGLLLEIDRRGVLDPEVGAIMAGMDRHGANQLVKRLAPVEGRDETALARDTYAAHWALKASIAGLMVREQQGNWPPFSLHDDGFKDAVTTMFFALLEGYASAPQIRAV